MEKKKVNRFFPLEWNKKGYVVLGYAAKETY